MFTRYVIRLFIKNKANRLKGSFSFPPTLMTEMEMIVQNKHAGNCYLYLASILIDCVIKFSFKEIR